MHLPCRLGACRLVFLVLFFFRIMIGMLDMSRAQLEPFRAFHYFHEKLNVYIKVSIAGAILLSTHAVDPARPRELGRLIKSAHPAWNMPPIHEFCLDHQRDIYRSTSAFAIVSLFSAFDDFMSGIEADQHHLVEVAENASAATEDGPNNSDDSDMDIEKERLFKLYARCGWSSDAIERYRPMLKYFRLIRNCIAHRSSRASRALEDQSADANLHVVIKPFLERTTIAAPTFKQGDQIFVDPTLAITCSDLLRKVAADCNEKFINSIGEDGFMRIVARNALLGGRPIKTNAYKSAEAVLNLALTERYRVRLPSRLYASARLKQLGVWKDFLKKFQAIYGLA